MGTPIVTQVMNHWPLEHEQREDQREQEAARGGWRDRVELELQTGAGNEEFTLNTQEGLASEVQNGIGATLYARTETWHTTFAA